MKMKAFNSLLKLKTKIPFNKSFSFKFGLIQSFCTRVRLSPEEFEERRKDRVVISKSIFDDKKRNKWNSLIEKVDQLKQIDPNLRKNKYRETQFYAAIKSEKIGLMLEIIEEYCQEDRVLNLGLILSALSLIRKTPSVLTKKEELIDLFEKINVIRVNRREEIPVTILSAFSRIFVSRGYAEEAQEIIMQIQNISKEKTDMRAFIAIIELEYRIFGISKAIEYTLNLQIEDQDTLNDLFFLLISICEDINEFDDAFLVFKSINEKGIKPSVPIYYLILRISARMNNPDLCFQIMSSMIENNTQSTIFKI